MAVRSAVTQKVQVGAETVPGTPVAAGKLLTAFTWTFGDKPQTKQFTPTGSQYPAASELLFESSAGKISGQGDFNQLVYLPQSCFGPVTPALIGASSTAYSWTYLPVISGPKPKKTYTLMNGDSNDAEQYAFVTVPAFGYSFTRKTELTITGDWFSQTFTDGATLTASPTELALIPMTGAQANVYLDTTSAGFGTSLITQDVLKVDFAAADFWKQYTPVNRANASYADIIDGMPKNTLKITFAASSAALAYIATYLRTGVRAYIRVDVLGGLIDVANAVAAEMRHDMCVFMVDAGELSDVDGAFAYETTWVVARDFTWTALAGGTAQKLYIANLLAAV